MSPTGHGITWTQNIFISEQDKQFSGFAVIIAIMKMCDHSEVIGEMFILETNAWQTASRISKANIHKVLRVIRIFYSQFFYKKFISTGTDPLGSKIVKSSVLNLHNHSDRNNYRWSMKTGEKLRRQANTFWDL